MLRRLPLLLSALTLLAACASSDTSGPTAPHSSASVAGGATIVAPGSSIQAAIDAAAPGSAILLQPGVYSEAITIDKPGIRLMGMGSGQAAARAVVIRNPGGAEDGISVTSAGAGVEIMHLTVQGFGGNGVLLTGVNGFHLADITTPDDGEYGLFPVFSSNGVIEGCSASGNSDTGIYVGQSRNVTIRRNVAFGNVNGIEVENSSFIDVAGTESYGNVDGILVVLLPGLDVKASSNILVRNNRVHDNNLANFSGGGLADFVPSGSGILVVGTDATTVQQNVVTGNSFVGIGVANSGLLTLLGGPPPTDIDPFPDHTRVLGNTVLGNGGAQPVPFLPPGVDLIWDGTGTDNCWSRNKFATSLDLDLLGGNPTPLLPACPPAG
ncbi:MAG TPA: parallel beta-helix domain-containing protein [Longimicrobiales bacterium]